MSQCVGGNGGGHTQPTGVLYTACQNNSDVCVYERVESTLCLYALP